MIALCRLFFFLLISLLISLLFTGCTARPSPSASPLAAAPARPVETAAAPGASAVSFVPNYWPTRDWRIARPEAQGMDGAMLAEMLDAIHDERLPLHSLLIFRNGYLVSENYFNGYNAGRRHEIFSCTKSFAATLVGIAVDQGLIHSVDDRILSYFPGQSFEAKDSSKDAMTLADVLTMTAGLRWTDTGAAFQNLYASRDWARYMLDLPMDAPPGQRWNYCSGCSHLLTSILQRVASQGTLAFAQTNLFEPLGIKNYQWETDAAGVPIGGWGLRMAPREMAKLGYLYLNDGRWDGEQVVSSEWIRQATRPRFDTDNENGLRYGYQWWTYPTHGAYAALGRDGQTIFVVPELSLIVVTTAEMDGHGQIFRLIDDYILPSANRATISPSEGHKSP